MFDSLYFLPTDNGSWNEGFIFGGSDKYYGSSDVNTKEIRLDITSQFTNEWRSRVGIDLKSHKLEFSENSTDFFVISENQIILFCK